MIDPLAPSSFASTVPVSQAGAVQDQPLFEVAKALEATFLAEMLKAAGLGDTPGTFGGGPGEEQFSSFLRAEQAARIVDRGGIGLAQSLFVAMTERADD